MALLINGAGGSTADPILRNLGIELVTASSSMDIATLTDVWVDSTAGFAGTNSIKSSLTPAATVLTSGNAGTYNDTNKRYTISSTTGLTVGDYLYLSHASLTAGVYKIATIPASGDVTVSPNPLDGQGNKTGVAYQVAWKYNGTTGTAPISSSGGGQINYLKTRAADSVGNVTDSSETFYVRDAPSGTGFIQIDGKDYTGQSTVDSTPSFSLLPTWSNKGGVSHVELAAHSVESVNNFQWGDATTAEKSISTALSSGFLLSGGDGIKYGRILLKSSSGAAVATLSGIGGLSADIAGKLEASAVLAGVGNIDASLGALASAVADLQGSGSLTGDTKGLANIGATISPFTELSPQSLATYVWSKMTSELNLEGSIGKKIIDGLPVGIKKGVAIFNFQFFMVDDTNHVTGKTGLSSFTNSVSIDGGSFNALTNSASEIGQGVYKINLTGAELDGDIITFRFSAAGADTRVLTVLTEG